MRWSWRLPQTGGSVLLPSGVELAVTAGVFSTEDAEVAATIRDLVSSGRLRALELEPPEPEVPTRKRKPKTEAAA